MPKTVRVELGSRGYDIAIGERLLASAGEYIAPLVKTKPVIIVTDEQVARLYLHRLTNSLEEKDISARPVVLPAGEQTKSFAQLEGLIETILEQKPDRGSLLIALGGGVIGDITGFAASIALRGIDFVQIPTTLLAQVDSAVGGKTAVNSRHGKNLIGSFHQPLLVLADISTLTTLPKREMRAGYAEIVKYGLINDAGFFGWLEKNGHALLAGNAAALTHAVAESCRAKAAIVASDERESGARALLNFGHTFAHALEAETGYSDTLLHGEAVAIGMVMAFELSVKLGLCDAAELARVKAHWKEAGLPASPLDIRNQWELDALMDHFSRDKKARGGKLTFVLTRGIGRAFVNTDTDSAAVRQAVAAACSLS